MSDLVPFAPSFSIASGQIRVTSLEVADRFGKIHKDVLKAIRNLECSSYFHERNFAPMFNTVEIGNGALRQDPMYEMTRDGFTFLAMGFTGKEAAQWKEAYIAAFNAMEDKLRGKMSIPVIPKMRGMVIGRSIKIKDIELGAALGLANPYDIRDLIRANRIELSRIAPVKEIWDGDVEWHGFFLDPRQARITAMLTMSPLAEQVQRQVNRIFRLPEDTGDETGEVMTTLSRAFVKRVREMSTQEAWNLEKSCKLGRNALNYLRAGDWPRLHASVFAAPELFIQGE